jgi:hypothetical protein
MRRTSLMRMHCLAVTATAVLLSASAAFPQQQPQGQRVSGTIERVEGNTIFGKGADGGAIVVKLADNAAITAVLNATVADIKPGDYVGTGAMPQADGSQRAVELRIFPKPQEDGGHFYEGWYGAPNGTMTNGFAQPVVATTGAGGASDPIIVVKYPQGEKRIVIPLTAHVVRNAFGSKEDLKAGAAFRVQAAAKQPDGTYTASAINVGRDGARPF